MILIALLLWLNTWWLWNRKHRESFFPPSGMYYGIYPLPRLPWERHK